MIFNITAQFVKPTDNFDNLFTKKIDLRGVQGVHGVHGVHAVNAVNTLIRIRLYGSKKSYQFVALFGFFILFLLVFRKSKNTK